MRWLVAFVIAAVAGLGWAPRASACAPAPPLGEHVTIAGEEAVILWDAERGIQHFIRSADFETSAASFGFIVPTPSVPELAEADAGIFEALASVVRPRVQTRQVMSGVSPTCFVSSFLMRSAGDSATGSEPVEVLKHRRVAGYDAVVLRSTDAQALQRWLVANGYDPSERLAQWAAAYVDQGWVFTAFKVAPAEGAAGVATSPVRMSFATDRPFYPYREPSADPAVDTHNGRVLRVFFVADERYGGALQDGTTWPGELTYAKAIRGTAFTHYLSADLIPASAYLTTFVDRSSPRPGDADLFFDPSPDGDFAPEPVVHETRVPFPLPIELLVLGIGLVLWLRWRRRAKAST